MEVLQVVRIIVLAIVCISLVAGFLYLRRHDTRRYAMASAVAAPGWGALGAINVAQGDFLLAALTLVLVLMEISTIFNTISKLTREVDELEAIFKQIRSWQCPQESNPVIDVDAL